MNTPNTVTDHNTHTVSFSRKKNLGNYESEDATFFVQFDTPSGTDMATVIAGATAAFVAAKVTVLDALGIDYQIDFDGTVIEGSSMQPADAAPAVTPAPLAAAAAPPEVAVMASFPGAQVVARDDSNPPYDSYTKDKAERKANTQWAVRKYQANPDDFYDNRADKDPGSSRPDFKHKGSGVAIWLDKNGQLPS